MFEQILVPVDFSEASRIAARSAGSLARHFRGSVTLLHSTDWPADFPAMETLRAEHAASCRKRLEEIAADELGGVRFQPIVCNGDPAKVIVQCAEASNAGMILMPTHGLGAFRRFLLGSVTAKVLHDCDRPVWTGAHLRESPYADPMGIENVICAVSLEERSAKLIEWAANFSNEIGAALTVTHAVLETPPGLPERYAFQWQEEAHWGADERLHMLLRDGAVNAEVLIVSDGNVPAALANAAREKAAGLLVIGRASHSADSGALGDQMYSIISRAACPVVSL